MANNKLTAEQWVIRCSVSGGLTGNRTSYLKEDGIVTVFQTEDAARAEAAQLNNYMNWNSNGVRFTYTPEQTDEEL
jgi:hypothetical protein